MKPSHAQIQKIFAKNHWLILKAVSFQRADIKGITADDIEQEVCIKLLNLIQSDPKNEKISSYSYIYRITSNVIIDLVRKNQKLSGEISIPDEDDDEFYSPSLISEEIKPDEGFANNEMITSVLSAIETLNENRRIAVKLRLQGFSVKEISEMTGWPFHKAGNLSKRGMNDLKNKLEELGINYEIN